MTSIPVSNVGNGVQTISGAKSALDFTNAQKAGSFQDAMDLFGKSDAQTVEKQPKVQPDQKPAEQKQPMRPGKDVVDSGAGKERISNPKTDDAQPQTELSEEELEKVQETAADIMRAIAEELDVSPEEVEQAMQLLGISFVDLGNSNQMAALMTELMDLTDSIQIVTDAALFESCTSLAQNADELLADLSEEIDVPVQDLTQLLPRQLPEDDFVIEPLPAEEETASDAEIVQEFVKDLAAPEITPSDERVPDYAPVQALTETKTPVGNKEPEREEAAPRTEAQDPVVKVQSETKEQAVTPEKNPESRMQDKDSEPKEHPAMYKNVTAF
ncbi:MAG: hypothetical protein IJ711_10385, partial [Lachnospiraceae bacterium]|nr:hypothetical protein [Lachnospiraceae bacterium]